MAIKQLNPTDANIVVNLAKCYGPEAVMVAMAEAMAIEPYGDIVKAGLMLADMAERIHHTLNPYPWPLIDLELSA